ncbi:MAG: hypothetical protein U5O16_25175 [Rhodococcus sp. (in: high G+C Gram-positive bacteria)]|uniref:Rv2732c family membrane protein n=1 Tax=Rhodococcus sp. TaxID=1831 RepID=UPI002AD6F608|nr:hypothetical protein [Rhodococcus sp. (in: high G+C Gram-positive bacteria)]
MKDDLSEYRDVLSQLEKKVLGTVRLGAGGKSLAVCAGLVCSAFILPYEGSTSGWGVLGAIFGMSEANLGFLTVLAVASSMVFGVLSTVFALVTSRLLSAFIAFVGCALAVIFGILAVWSQQTSLDSTAPSGPAVGVVVGTAVMAVMVVQWLCVIGSPPINPRCATTPVVDARH